MSELALSSHPFSPIPPTPSAPADAVSPDLGRADAQSTARAILHRLARFWHIRRAIRELEALDDHLLRDIGLRRSEIVDAVQGRSPTGHTGQAVARRPELRIVS